MVKEKPKDAEGDRGNNFMMRLFKLEGVGGVLATQRATPSIVNTCHTTGEL